MSESKDIATNESKSPQEAKDQERATRPPVDIFEDKTGITVQADMPGVSRERLDVHIDSDTLLIEGVAEIPMPQDMQAVYADVRSTRYQRSFSLSSELDGDRAEATLKDGVLTLRIPKREQFQPRKIEIRVD